MTDRLINREKVLHTVRLTAAAFLAGLVMQPVQAAAAEELLIGLKPAESTQAAMPENAGTEQQAEGDTVSGETAQPEGAGAAGTAETAEAEDEEDNAWCLILVNKTHPIPGDYEIPELTQLSGGHAVDSRIYPYLQQMFDDARAQGIYPSITSSYRTYEQQQGLMDDKISEYLAAGNSQEEAVRLAGEWVAQPGTSEHQLGLCVDISVDESTGQDAGSVWYWLLQNCTEYGFIKRYPEDKTDITGIINEPWHYRYVGKKAAKEMTEKNLCLEEYLGETD